MAEKEKRTILDMRVAGKQYKEISAKLGIDVSALKVFVHRQKHNDVKRCVQCKKVLPKCRVVILAADLPSECFSQPIIGGE